MAIGLRVINDDSELLIDSEYVNPTFVQKVEFNTTPIREEAGGFYLHRYYTLREYVTPSITAPGNYIVLWTIPENVSGGTHKDVWYSFPTSVASGTISFSCYVFSNALVPVTYTLPTAYVFAVDSASVSALYSAGPALRMYNSASGKTFDSNLTQLVPYSFSDDVTLPTNTTGDSTITLSSIPTNPIFLLPNSDLLSLVNTRVYFSNYPGHIETVTTTSFRRVGGAVTCRANGIYSAQEDTILPQDTYVFQNGATNSLSLMVADADFYQAPGAGGNIGGNNPQYQLTSNYYTVNEGATFVITLTTTLTTNGTVFPYTVTGINAADLSFGSLQGNFVIQSNSATATFTVSNDVTLEGTESFTLTVQGLNLQVSVSILDTSKPAGVYSFGAVTPVNEGTTTGYVNFEHQYAAGKTVSFAIVAPTSGTAATSADVTLNYLSAPGLVINQGNNQGTFAVGYDVVADNTTEGPEYFRVSATVDGTTYYSGNILINDTSLTAVSYGITASNNWLESSTGNIANVTATGVNGTTLYFTTDNAVVTPQTTSATVNSNNYNVNVSYNVGLVTSTTSVTLEVRTGSASGQVVASKVVSIANANPAYSFGAVSPLSEGTNASIQFNFSNAAGVSIGFSVIAPTSGANGSGDIFLYTTDYTVDNTDAAGSVSVSYGAGNDQATEGLEYFRIQAYVNGVYYTSANITINDTSLNPVYGIFPVNPPWNENTVQATTIVLQNVMGYTYYPRSDSAAVTCQTDNFYVSSENFTTTLYWNVGAVSADTTVNVYLRRSRAAGNIDAAASVVVKNVLAAGTAIGGAFCVSYGTSPYTLRQVRADGAGGTYNDDTTNSPTCGYTPPATYSLIRSVSSVNENGSFTITFSTNQSGSFGYTISGVTSADLSGASLTGTVSNGSQLSYSVAADQITEGTETFTISLNNGQALTTVTIGDTSQYPPNGTVLNEYCLTYSAPYTYRRVIANGSGGSTNQDTNNSPTCGYVAPPAAGTNNGGEYCGTGANQYTLYQNKNDGSGGVYATVVATNSPSCGYVAPSYSLGGTFTSLNNGAATSFYLQVTNPPAGDNVYVSVSGAGAARVTTISPEQFTTNTGTTIYYIYIGVSTPTSNLPAQSVTVTVAHNNGAVSKSFSFTIPEYTVASAAPVVTSVVVVDSTYFAGEGIDAVINFSGIITADTYIRIRIGPAGGFGTLYYPSISGAAQSGTSGAYGDYITWSVGTYSAYYAGPVNPGGFYPPITGVRISAQAVTAGGSDRQGYVLSSTFTLDGGSSDR